MGKSRRFGEGASTQRHAHEGPGGFAWTLDVPERRVSAIGAKKPQATILVSGAEPLHVPVAVARALEAGEGPEPGSRAELLFLVREAADACAWARLVDLASRREYSSTEAAERLRQDGYAPACVERALARATEKRVISDTRFADAYIRSKLACGWGPVRIERELARRGVEASELAGWPDDYLGERSAHERARELLDGRRIPEKNAYAKLMRFLVSRGYSAQVAGDVVHECLAAQEAEG